MPQLPAMARWESCFSHFNRRTSWMLRMDNLSWDTSSSSQVEDDRASMGRDYPAPFAPCYSVTVPTSGDQHAPESVINMPRITHQALIALQDIHQRLGRASGLRFAQRDRLVQHFGWKSA